MSLSDKSNINPKIWGPYFWETFHFVAFGYPESPNENDKNAYKEFYESFVKVLPCNKCSISSQEFFKESDIDSFLKSKQDLIKWTYNFHKKVNNKLNKNSPTLEEFVYNFKNRNNAFSSTNIHMIILLIILFVVMFLIFMHCTSNSL
tara:strand:+ start:991 stop:1431 length:441 start_codon:yes stop_codon:yes gene_type:complete